MKFRKGHLTRGGAVVLQQTEERLQRSIRSVRRSRVVKLMANQPPPPLGWKQPQ